MGIPPTGNPGIVEDSVEDGMDLEETTVSVVRKSVEKSGSRTSTSRLAHTSTSTSTRSKYKDDGDVHDKDNGQTTRVDDARVVMDLEASVAGQSVVKSGSNYFQKKASRSASGTSRLANISTRTTMGSNGHSTGSVDNDGMEAPVAGQSMEKSTLVAGQSVDKSRSTSLQKEASRSASGTSRLATTSTNTKTTHSNGHSTRSVDDARVDMDLEESQPDWKARRDGSASIHTPQDVQVQLQVRRRRRQQVCRRLMKEMRRKKKF
jgi:hypothetical protein